MPVSGVFITFEGIDGCGKSTQVELLVEWLRARGIEPLMVREPGGTPLGEQMRNIVLDLATGDIDPRAEALIYATSRAELVNTVIAPALAEGRVVIADRFVDSSLAYQGVGRGLGIGEVRAANKLAIGPYMPNVTVLLAIDANVAAVRRAGNSDDRIEAAGIEFQRVVAEAYNELAAGDSRFHVVDATKSVEAIHGSIVDRIETELEAAGIPASVRAGGVA
jgi:dTMP kinase